MSLLKIGRHAVIIVIGFRTHPLVNNHGPCTAVRRINREYAIVTILRAIRTRICKLTAAGRINNFIRFF
jgi:hypothetical protein